MHAAYLAFAVPLFLFFIGLEYYYSHKKGKNFFHFAESVANLNVGIAERLLDIMTMAPFFYFFGYIHDHFALFDFKAGWLSWIGLFLLTDFVWYWYHRLAHEINLFWAAHVVHHQSEDFNYTVSARITVFQSVIRCLFWSVLPLIGFPPAMISIFLLIHGIYPFFIHTRSIGKLGWLEKILVTPSHHRVHHAAQPQYLDKNYGDILIIWDKLFGTFAEEKEEPVYGLTHPLGSYSFLWQHFHYALELLIACRRSGSVWESCKIIFGPPAKLDPRIRQVLEKKLKRNATYLRPTRAHKIYIGIQTLISLLLLFFGIFFYEQLSLPAVLLLSAFILTSLVNTGAILEQRSWIFFPEMARIAIVLMAISLAWPDLATGIFITTGAVGLACFYRPMEKKYHRFLFHESNS
jgi:alkylglycerol monooxygenase